MFEREKDKILDREIKYWIKIDHSHVKYDWFKQVLLGIMNTIQ